MVARNPRVRVGQRLQVTEGSGLESGHIGTVVRVLPPGVRSPGGLGGHSRTGSVAILRDDKGNTFEMFTARLGEPGKASWRRQNPGVPDEGPIEHLKNAAAIIQANLELGDKDALVADDAKAVLARIKTALRQLEERGHVYMGLPRRGNRRSVRHGNPALMVLGANPRVADATLATWAKIEYMRPDDPDGGDVVRVHEFKDGFEIAWLDDGSVQLSHPRHPLWTDDKT